MLNAVKGKSRKISNVYREGDSLYLVSEAGQYRLEPKAAHIVRITYTQRDGFSTKKKPGVINEQGYSEWQYSEENGEIHYETPKVRICIDKETAAFRYYDSDGVLLLRERDYESKTLEEFPIFKASGENMRVEKVATADGVKDVVREAEQIQVGTMYHTRLFLEWQENEALYGLGQHEEGLLNLRGQTVYVHQANKKIAVPMLVSSLGYGLLVDTYSPLIFQDTAYGSYIYTEADEEMDYYFIYGSNMDGVIGGYRELTGKATLLPRWAYGYIQSQERYETAEEILAVAEEYRSRGIGLDCIVLDWCSWEGYLWGQKTFDAERFPDPAAMIEKLHQNNVHFMISIWPNMDEKAPNYKEFKEAGLLLPGCSIYDALSEEGRSLYWKQAEEGLFRYGVDAWWCDNSEPFTPEWNHFDRVEPGRMYEEYCKTAAIHLPAEQGNAFALYHAQALFEGQRSSTYGQKKRVVNLTRSGYTGQQRYGTILWSGDIAASWDTYRKQIAAGLGFCASGLPFWTVDVGAFFVKDGSFWYWKGMYDDTTEDMGYRELFVRWYQWACFLPIFRGHGTDCRRELWKFGDKGEVFYEALLKANRLRYELMPYIYSLAGMVWLENASMMKPLAFDYPKDTVACDIKNQYLFGSSIMVCPVTTPMYYEVGSKVLENVPKCRRVYLPEGNGWYDYWTHAYYEGGQWIDAEADIEKLPLFVKEGGLIPRTAPAQSTAELTETLQLDIYAGRDGSFVLYEDAGDSYGYEQGEYHTLKLEWKEEEQQLSAIPSDKFNTREMTITIIQKDGTKKEEKKFNEKTGI